MTTAAAIAVCVLLGLLAVLQLALAAGAPLGRFVWGGQHDVLPTRLRLGSLLSVPIYALMGAVVLDRAGLVSLGLSDSAVRVLTWVLVGYFAVGVAVNLASRSRSERAVMTPTVAVLAALTAVVATS